MTELLTAAQMRSLEAAAIASGEVTGLELMERAGRAVVEAIFEEWPDFAATSHRAVVLCGPGNNGGDGFVVARLLKEWGWEVEVFLYGDAEKLPPDAKVNYDRWCGMGAVRPWDADGILAHQADFYVDAVFGAGLSRVPDDAILSVHTELYASARTVDRLVAIDAPTGLCMDSGKDLGGEWGAVYAFLTVTFHAARTGHFLAKGQEFCEKVVVKDIGLANWHREGVAEDAAVKLLDDGFAEYLRFFLGKSHNGHKYSNGHALILAGGVGKGGAARLAARGALRIGAGAVTVGCPPAALIENAARLDAIMLKPVKDAEGLAGLLEDRRINALCLGPGMGMGAHAAALMASALGVAPVAPPSPPHEGEGGREGPNEPRDDQELPLPLVGRGEGRGAPRSIVLDADALTILSRRPDLFAALHDRCILTPHAGEFARLFPDIAAKLAEPVTKGPAYSKVDATRDAAKRAGCVVLYKGPDTVIAHPDGRCSLNSALYDRLAPWLATAGSGDVLAGFITGLLARDFDPMEAAEAAAWLHVECARSFGPGLIAEDLPEELPKVFRDLGI